MNIDSLNNKQKEAVINTDGPMLILAGAGSGKTKVLTTKIAYLIEEKGIDPYNILAITFTNKAANEMKSRVENMLGTSSNMIQISTFHSFGLSIIKRHCEKLGFKKCIVPAVNMKKLKKFDRIEICPFYTIREVIDAFL